jgi:putative peptidoglycan lipid II flippase
MAEEERIIRAAGLVGSFTLLSRVFGLLRDIVVASFFGATMAADAFYVAFRIPNLLRRLLAEGALSISFIPIFTEYLTREGKGEAIRVAQITMTLMIPILILVSTLGILFSSHIIGVFAPGFYDEPNKFALTVLLNRIMFPFIFFVGLVALAMGILNSLNHFAAPAFAPVCLNLSIISSTIFLSRYLSEPIIAVAIGVMIGGLIQLLLQIPFLGRAGMMYRLDFHLDHPAVRKMGLLFGPAVLGVAVYHLDVFVSTVLASLLEEGSVSYLYYASRFFEFPQGIFVISVATVVFPSLSRYGAEGDMEGFKTGLSLALRLVFFITIPATIGLIILRVPLIKIFFQRGVFDEQTTWATAQALLYYSLGLWSVAGARIMVQAYYSLKDTKTPALLAFVTFLINLCLSIILMGPLSYRGLALANSLASVFNFGSLVWVLRRKLGEIRLGEIGFSFAKTGICSAIMGLGVYLYCQKLLWNPTVSWFQEGFSLLGAIILGSSIFLALAYLLKAKELSAILRLKENGRSMGRL